MTMSLLIIAAIAALLGVIAILRKPQGIPGALVDMRNQMLVFGLRLPPALLAAAFLSLIVPTEYVVPYIGAESGWQGVLIASLFGAFIPGGPILTFPMALVLWRAGAGEAQMVALLASWSVFAVHRVISYELPFLGPRFVLVRLSSSWILPFVSGFLALAVLLIHPF